MADQAAITSLLAALARAQQQQQQSPPLPFSTTGSNAASQPQLPPHLASQQQQQHPQNAAALLQSLQSLMGGAGGSFPGAASLPQPTNSGQLDLSSLVKPTSSGELSLGGSSDNRRSGDRKRNRSRSPPGRDGSDRYRSRSPVHRSRSRGAGRVHHDTMYVDPQYVGMIIGRRGETLKMVEDTTGARVQFVAGGKDSAERVCDISGTWAQIDAGRAAITKLIEGYSRERRGGGGGGGGGGSSSQQQAFHQQQQQEEEEPQQQQQQQENSLDMSIPERSVGMIIGKGGETIRELQDRTRCHISIANESHSQKGQRPLKITGASQDAIHYSQRLLEHIVQSDRIVFELPAAVNSSGRPSNTSASKEQTSDLLKIPTEAVGAIIGRGGDIIRELSSASNCKISISTTGDIEREVSFHGAQESVRKAKELVQERVDNHMKSRRDYRGAPAAPAGGGGGAPGFAGGYWPQQGSDASGGGGAAPAAAAPGTGTDAQADPYAAYGGYENYVQMWQLYQQQQQQQLFQQQQQQQPPKDGH